MSAVDDLELTDEALDRLRAEIYNRDIEPELDEGSGDPPDDPGDGDGDGDKTYNIQLVMDLSSQVATMTFHKVSEFSFRMMGDDRLDGVWPEHYFIAYEQGGIEMSVMVPVEGVAAVVEWWS